MLGSDTGQLLTSGMTIKPGLQQEGASVRATPSGAVPSRHAPRQSSQATARRCSCLCARRYPSVSVRGETPFHPGMQDDAARAFATILATRTPDIDGDSVDDDSVATGSNSVEDLAA